MNIINLMFSFVTALVAFVLVAMVIHSQSLKAFPRPAAGPLVAFESRASNLVSFDSNGVSDIFIQSSSFVPKRISLSPSGTEGNNHSNHPSCSTDCRFVAYDSLANNLVTGDLNGVRDIFLRDVSADVTFILSLSTTGDFSNGVSSKPSITETGNLISFQSRATNFVSADTDSLLDIYVRDRVTSTTNLVSLSSAGIKGNDDSINSSVANAGRFVAFESRATNLVTFDNNGVRDVFVRDLLMNTTDIVSVSSNGTIGNDNSFNPSISRDGRFVAFASDATNLGAANGFSHIYVHDRHTWQTTLVSRNTSGLPANGHSRQPAISDDGKYITYTSLATDLVANDLNGFADVFVTDWVLGETIKATLNNLGHEANNHSKKSDISANGQWVVYESLATNLSNQSVSGTYSDVFIRDLIMSKTHLVSRKGTVSGDAVSKNSNVSN